MKKFMVGLIALTSLSFTLNSFASFSDSEQAILELRSFLRDRNISLSIGGTQSSEGYRVKLNIVKSCLLSLEDDGVRYNIEVIHLQDTKHETIGKGIAIGPVNSNYSLRDAIQICRENIIKRYAF